MIIGLVSNTVSLKKKKKILFIYSTEVVSEHRRGEQQRQREKQAPRWAQPDAGLDPRTPGSHECVEGRCLTNWATQAPQEIHFLEVLGFTSMMSSRQLDTLFIRDAWLIWMTSKTQTETMPLWHDQTWHHVVGPSRNEESLGNWN